jgi:RNA ligase (TIGR02306 family)
MTTQLLTDPADEVRTLVRLETISSIDPIVGADAIEAATVGGWTVVISKGDFAEGDTVIYFEVDSALPLDDDRFAFLAEYGEKVVVGKRVHVLKTVRKRGVYSQGLVLPFSDFTAEWGALYNEPGSTLDELLGITKYEPPMPENIRTVGPFTGHLGPKTSAERAQNLTGQWSTIVAAGPWVATEKLDGTSLSVFRDTDGALRVNSRNWELEGPEPGQKPGLHWRAVLDNNLGSLLAPGQGIQAEIVGPGVLPRNPLGLTEVKVFVFAFTDGGVARPRGAWPSLDHLPNVSPAPVYTNLVLAADAKTAVEDVDGIKSLVVPGRLAEGVVWHRASGEPLAELGHRSTLKVLSNRVLAKPGA